MGMSECHEGTWDKEKEERLEEEELEEAWFGVAREVEGEPPLRDETCLSHMQTPQSSRFPGKLTWTKILKVYIAFQTREKYIRQAEM